MIATAAWFTVTALLACTLADSVTWPGCPNARNFRVIQPRTVDYDAVHLYLKNCIITRLLTGSFHNTPNLTWIELEHNKIERLDADIFEFTYKLSGLFLGDNKILGKNLPSNIFRNCQSLKRLDISGNDMSETPINLLQGIDLHNLDVSNCSLREFPRFVTHNSFKYMSFMDLSHNLIQSVHDPETFACIPNIQELNLAGNAIGYVNKDVFKHLKALLDLDLSGNKIKFLHEHLFQDIPNLGIINLSDNNIEYVPRDSFRGTPLYELNLNSNELTQLPLHFCTVLKYSQTEVRQLHIDNNPWQCACLGDILLEMKMLGVSYSRERYNGRHQVCVMNSFKCNRFRDDYRLMYAHFPTSVQVSQNNY